MKKLITAAMALALIAGMASAQVNSDNIVGFVTITNAAGDTYPLFGATFVQVGNTNGEWRLGDITAVGMDADAPDIIQFLDPTDLNVTMAATYVDKAKAIEYGDTDGSLGYQGWWDAGDVLGTSLDETKIVSGTGFLCNIGSGSTVVFTFTGEVVQDTTSLDLTGMTYPIIANPVPAELTLGVITADGMDADAPDIIQFLDPVSLVVIAAATYVDQAKAIEYGDTDGSLGYQGWWDAGDVLGTNMDGTIIPAGTAVLFNIGSGNPINIVFPNPLL